MARKLKKVEFDRYEPARGPMVGTVIKEQEWYDDGIGNVIGTLTLDGVDNDWGYVVLGRDERGVFRAIDFDVSIATKEEATMRLIEKIHENAASGMSVFPQND